MEKDGEGGRRLEENEGRGFKIVSKQAFVLSPRFPLSPSLSSSPSPLSLSLSLTSLLSASVYCSVGICSDFPPASAPDFLSCLTHSLLLLFSSLTFSLSDTHSWSWTHHGEQITSRLSWHHGCLPLQRSQRSVHLFVCLFVCVFLLRLQRWLFQKVRPC